MACLYRARWLGHDSIHLYPFFRPSSLPSLPTRPLHRSIAHVPFSMTHHCPLPHILVSSISLPGHHKAMGHPHQHQGLDGRRRVSLHPSHRPAPSSLGAAEDKEQEEEGGEEEE